MVTDKQKAYNRAYYLANRGKAIRKAKLYVADNKEKTLAYQKQYRLDNKDRLDKQNKEYRKVNSKELAAYQKEYRKNNAETIRAKARVNPSRVSAKAAKRRGDKLKRTPTWLTEEHLADIKEVYWLAKDCYVVSGQEYHVDHIVPLLGERISGLHVPWNLQVLPADINLSKGNRYDQD